jgi:hypothetical protein
LSQIGLTTPPSARLGQEGAAINGLDPRDLGRLSLRRTMAVLTPRRSGKIRAVELLLGLCKVESPVGFLSTAAENANEVA